MYSHMRIHGIIFTSLLGAYDECHGLDMTFLMSVVYELAWQRLIFPAEDGKFKNMDEQGLTNAGKGWREQIRELRALLADMKPLLVAAEMELSEKLAAISEFEFGVRSRLEPLTRRMDQLDKEINDLREQLRILQQDSFDTDEFDDGDLFQQWRSSTEAGAAAAGDYRYRQAPTTPPQSKLTADQSAELKRLYRQLARRFHPDFALDADDRAYRTLIMMELNAAYTAGDIDRLQELSLEPDPQPGEFTDEDLVQALLKEWHRCRRRMEEIELELVRLEKHPSAELLRRTEKAANEGRDLLEELASELRERIASKMVRRDVLKDEIELFRRGEYTYGSEDLAEMVYDLGLEQAFDEDPLSGVSEWREKNRERIDFDDVPDESVWDELRKMRNRQRKK